MVAQRQQVRPLSRQCEEKECILISNPANLGFRVDLESWGGAMGKMSTRKAHPMCT